MPVYTTSEVSFGKIRQKLIKRNFITALVTLMGLGLCWENSSMGEFNFITIITGVLLVLFTHTLAVIAGLNEKK